NGLSDFDSLYIAATPNPRATDPRSGGTEFPGASPVVDPREAQALSAPARQLTPQADERELAGTPPDNPDHRAPGAGARFERIRERRRHPERVGELGRRRCGAGP